MNINNIFIYDLTFFWFVILLFSVLNFGVPFSLRFASFQIVVLVKYASYTKKEAFDLMDFQCLFLKFHLLTGGGGHWLRPSH